MSIIHPEPCVEDVGPPGPPGPQGPPGPPGSGGGGAASYIHHQTTPSAVWTISHMLGFKPGGIIVEDSAGTVVETGQIVYPDVNTVVLTFSDQSGPVSFGGTAYVS